jgi:hypothetical protein
LHQILVADLVAPVMIAEYGDMRTRTSALIRLGENSWIHADLAVYCEAQDRDGFVEGAPLLAVEVASDASRARDLGAKRELYAAHGVPCYWVVDLTPEGVRVHIHALRGGRLLKQAEVGMGESVRLTEPFKIEIRPDRLFSGLPPWRGPVEGACMAQQNGPDLPDPQEAFEIDAFVRRWPTGAEKVELENGHPVFYGRWDERDVEIARRTYPGRVVKLDQRPGVPGTLRILPAASVTETAPQRIVDYDRV